MPDRGVPDALAHEHNAQTRTQLAPTHNFTDAYANRQIFQTTESMREVDQERVPTECSKVRNTGAYPVGARSRLGESNPGPTHYECVALAD